MRLFLNCFIIIFLYFINVYAQSDSFVLLKNDDVIYLKAVIPKSEKTEMLADDNSKLIDSAVQLLNGTGTIVVKSGTYEISSVYVPESIVLKMEEREERKKALLRKGSDRED